MKFIKKYTMYLTSTFQHLITNKSSTTQLSPFLEKKNQMNFDSNSPNSLIPSFPIWEIPTSSFTKNFSAPQHPSPTQLTEIYQS